MVAAANCRRDRRTTSIDDLLFAYLFIIFSSGSGLQGALRKINRLAAGIALLGLVEFIGEDLFLGTALWAGAGKRFKMFKILKTGTVLRGCHGNLLCLRLTDTRVLARIRTIRGIA
jgi:hypothetical protein